jgi:hypothetical protein
MKFVCDVLSRSMAQVVSRRPLTAEAWVRAQVDPCEICGGQIGTGAGFSPSFFFRCHIPPSLSELISSAGINNVSASGSSLTPW